MKHLLIEEFYAAYFPEKSSDKNNYGTVSTLSSIMNHTKNAISHDYSSVLDEKIHVPESEDVSTKSLHFYTLFIYSNPIHTGVLTRWTLHLQNICFEIEKFCDVKLTSSEHVDTRPSRIVRDNKDATKLSQWLSEHNNPFPKIDVIMSIDSGIVGADRYVQYLNNKYGQDIAVTFDRFPDDDKKSTKNCERLRRAAHFSPDVIFHEETVLQYTKEKLLANECNKKRFIELLKKALQKAIICVQQAVEDADLTIVNTAISVAPQYDYLRVVGEDIDLLVLLTALASAHSNVVSKSVEEEKRQIVITQPHHLIINSRINFCLFMLPVVVISHQHCLAKIATNYRCCSTACHEKLPLGANMVGKRKRSLEWGWMHTPSGLFSKKSEKVSLSDFSESHQSPSFNTFPVLARMHVDAGKHCIVGKACIVLYYANIALDSLAKIQCQSF
ncbi:hypothetical protein AVEN_164249-1 [Araneus ventricosus]|uniref:Uncharacterized protein n=1 Tax=Araneus ventricosus TaxID=182803 RepID=A0A4Y2D2A9_ARAVE|nr:hypothetical protein AVEN_164249-1 [Araneus ventricosus]